MVPQAIDNYQGLLSDADSKIRMEASKTVLQTTGIVPSHVSNTYIANIHNSQDVHISAEIRDIQAFLDSRWSQPECDAYTRNRTDELTTGNDCNIVDVDIIDAPKNTPKSDGGGE
jgi:hypothetical protein